MSSPARRKENQRRFDEESAAREEERNRKEALSMWGRIEEADVSEDVKDILHRIAQHVGLEE